MILSRDNKNVRLALKLKSKKYREAEGKYLIEGIRFVEEAIKEEVVEYLLYSQKLFLNSEYTRVIDNDNDNDKNNNCIKYEIDENVLKEISGTESPQGVVAVIHKKSYRLNDITEGLIIIGDGIQDPGNLGTIIRTSDAAGASGVILTRGTVDVYNDKVLRSTMGSIFHIPVILEEDFSQIIATLKNKNYNIYATSLQDSDNIYNCNFSTNTAIIIGNEANGIPEEHMALVDKKIKIPMPGRAESLNAASAAAILIYEVLRQNGKY